MATNHERLFDQLADLKFMLFLSWEPLHIRQVLVCCNQHYNPMLNNYSCSKGTLVVGFDHEVHHAPVLTPAVQRICS